MQLHFRLYRATTDAAACALHVLGEEDTSLEQFVLRAAAAEPRNTKSVAVPDSEPIRRVTTEFTEDKSL